MELQIITPENTVKGKMQLPDQFSEPLRHDLIQRAVETIHANTRQPYGADPRAGKKSAAKLSRRRRKYKGAYGKGISRVPRKTHSRRGDRMIWVGAYAPGMVGGRRAFPPRSWKQWKSSLNNSERRKAIRSCLAATLQKETVTTRGHKAPQQYPYLIDDAFENLTKTKTVLTALEKIGLSDELERSSKKNTRAGKGKSRGRPYVKRKGPLIVVSKQCPLQRAGRNIPGIDLCDVTRLNAELLAPGGVPGRLTLYTASAIKTLNEKRLYT
ncbi:50S ribosomal protein L4 [Candidatus Woesearchaeota archaeon]|nr:50S ribosomal protein L4 [Candidatus Woesearchaeota archaeon]